MKHRMPESATPENSMASTMPPPNRPMRVPKEERRLATSLEPLARILTKVDETSTNSMRGHLLG